MRCGYFDCFSGAAGDMILAALIDAGVPVEVFEQTIAALGLPGVTITAEHVTRHGLAAVHVNVIVPPESRTKHRHLPQILKIIDDARLAQAPKQRAAAVFQRLAEAEAAVHGTTVEKVHFHEVGAADAIVDIVGACVGIEHLGLTRITCSPIPPGTGSVTCDHGVMPVPAPATAVLLKGVPLAVCEEPGELTTPTGAAILTTVADSFGPPPALRISSIGYGAGTREGQTRPNVLRLIVGEIETSGAQEQDTVCVLEAQVDDATGQQLAFACQRLLEAGALDAWLVPIIMKKGRPGHLLALLCRPQDADRLEVLVLRETTTFGVRRYECRRSKLAREPVSVETRYGPIRVKIGRRGGALLRATPEYEDCAEAARRAGVTLDDVQRAALAAWKRVHDAQRGEPVG